MLPPQVYTSIDNALPIERKNVLRGNYKGLARNSEACDSDQQNTATPETVGRPAAESGSGKRDDCHIRAAFAPDARGCVGSWFKSGGGGGTSRLYH